MQREGLRQRIRYLIEHGGAYPEAPCPKDKRDWAIVGLLLLVALLEVANFFY